MDAAGEVQRLLQLVEVYEDVTATFDSMAAVKLPACLVLDSAAALVMSLFKMGLPALAVHVLRLKVPEAQQVIRKAAAGELPLLPARNDLCRLCVVQQRTEDTSYFSNFAGDFGEREDYRPAKNLHLLQAASGYLLLHAVATVSLFQSKDCWYPQADKRQALLETIQNLGMVLAAMQTVSKDSDAQTLLSDMQAFAQQAVGLIARSCRCLATARFSGTAAELLSRLLQRVEPPKASVSSRHWNIRWQLAQLRAARGEWDEAQSICSAAANDLAGAVNEAPAKWRRGIEHLQLLFSTLLIKCKLWTQQVHSGDAFEELQRAVKRFVAVVYPEQPPQARQAKAASKPDLESDANSTSSDVKRVTLHEHLRKLSSTLVNCTSEFALMPFRKGCAATESKRLLLSLSLAVLHPGSVEGGSTLNKNGNPTGGSSVKGGKSHQNDEAGNLDFSTESQQVGGRGSTRMRREDPKGGRRKRGGTGGAPSRNGVSGESVFADVLLLKAAELADAPLSDLLLAAEKLDAVFVAESHQAAAEAKASIPLPTASAHDSTAAGRKKGARPSVAGPAGAPGPANPVDLVRDAVRTAQTAAASLPLSAHVELLWRVADMKSEAPAGKLAKIWNALQYRFIYMNFFSPPLLELETFELFDCAADGGWALRELEDKLRVGWVVASSCDLQGLQKFEEISISVPSKITQLQTKSQPGEGINYDELRASSAGQDDTTVAQAPCARILLARYWDWETSLRHYLSSSSDTTSNVEGNVQLPMGSSIRAHADHSNQPAGYPHMNIEAGGSDFLADVSNRLALICGVQLINAESFEDAAAKYRAERQREASATSKMGEGLSSQAMQPTAADRQLHAERALSWIYDLEELSQRTSSLRRLVRRQKNGRPLAATLVFSHGSIKGQNASAHYHKVFGNGSALKEPRQGHVEGNISSSQGRTDCFDTEGASGGNAVGSSARTSSSRIATVHVVLLRSCTVSLKTKFYQFLVYTKLSADCPCAGDADSPVESSWWKESTLQGDDRSKANSVANVSSDVSRWRARGGPRSILQSCLGVHLDAACLAEESSTWPAAPLSRFNTMLQARQNFIEGPRASQLTVWTETESDLPLCVLAIELQVWSLMHSLSSAAGASRDSEEHEHLLSGGGSSFVRAEASGSQSAGGRLRSSAPNVWPSQHICLRLVLEITTVLTHAFAIDAFEVLLKHFASTYINQVLSSLWSSHVLPIAMALFHGRSTLRAENLPPASQPSSRQQDLKDNFGYETADADELLMLEEILQMLGGLMVKCKFTHLRPLAAVVSLLFHSPNQPLHQPKGRDLLRSLIAQAEQLVSRMAMPFVEALDSTEANMLLASADPVAHFEYARQAHDTARSTASGSAPKEELYQNSLRQMADRPSLHWEAEPAEAWSLLFTLYDIEARRANRQSNNSQSTNQSSASYSKHKADGSSTDAPVAAATTQHKGKDNNAAANDGAAGNMADKHPIQRQAGRNMYYKCLALCAQAESMRPHEGATVLAGALKEVSSIEELEAKWICTTKSDQTWNTLYGGLLRTHGGLGVSRLQKDVVGTGLRFKPHEVVRIQSLEESELYVVAYEEGGETRSAQLSIPTLPLSCCWPLPLVMLRSRLFSAALRKLLKCPLLVQEILCKMWRLVALPDGTTGGKKPQGWRMNEKALARLPPSVLRAIAEGAIHCFQGEKYRNRMLHSGEEMADILETLLRQSTNLQLAVFSDSPKIVGQQLASMLNSLHALIASSPLLPAKALKAILRTLTATDALPRDYITPSARAMEGALLGFACLAASEFQIPIIQGLLSEGPPKCLTLTTTAGAVLTPLEKRVLLHSWLSSCILAASTCAPSASQATQLMERFPPPAWAFENRGAESKLLPALLSALLQSSADIESSVQRLFDIARSLIKSRTEEDDSSILGLVGTLLSMALKRFFRQSDWTTSIDMDDLIMEAENLLEAAAPLAAAALHEAANAVAFTYTRNAEPLVDWLCSRKALMPLSVANKTTAADTGEKTSVQAQTLQAQQIQAQGEEFERRIQSTQVAAFTSPEREAALWIAHCFSVLLAPPLQAVSVHHRTVSTCEPSSEGGERSCGLFDFERIAEDAALAEPKEPDVEHIIFATGEPSQKGATSPNKGDPWVALTKTSSRSGVSTLSTGSGAAAPRTGAKSDKGGDESRAERQSPPTADSSLCPALLALLQRGAAAASRAVLAGAPLLAHSVIMQLGNALLVAERSLDLLSVCLESPLDGLADERKTSSETAVASTTSAGKEPTAFGMHENAKTDGSPNSKTGKKSDSKGHVRSPGFASLGVPTVTGSKQQMFEGKLPTSSWAAAGLVAYSCVELLRLSVLRYLRIIDKSDCWLRSANADLTSLETSHGAGGSIHSALEATEISPNGAPLDSQNSESASRLSLLCQNAFDLTKINTLHVGAVFIFCIRILLGRSRWHQVVDLCRRFSQFARGQALRCALSLALVAQQRIISAKEEALLKVQAHKNAAVEANELADEKLSDAKAAAIEKDLPESMQAASKRRATRQPEAKAEPTSSPAVGAAEETARLASEAVTFWAERETAMSASIDRQKHVEKWLRAQISHANLEVMPSDNLLKHLNRAREELREAKRSGCDKELLEQLLHKALIQHQRAVTTLRKQQQLEQLFTVLFHLGTLSWIGQKTELAERSWREAVEASFSSRNILKEWIHLAPHLFIPSEAQVDVRLRSLLPLHRWASLVQRRSHHEQLHAALLASRILEGILLTTADLPFSTDRRRGSAASIQFFAARSDGGLVRHRIKQLYGRPSLLQISFLTRGADENGIASAQLIEALLWFSCLLRCCEFTRAKSFPLLSVAEYVAADVCRNIQLATHCRIVRSLLCIECGDLQAAYWQLKEVAWGRGAADASLFERGEFPGTLFPGGPSAVLPLVASDGGNEKQQKPVAAHQGPALQGFSNFQTTRAKQNMLAQDDLWSLTWRSQLAELYGMKNVRRFTLAKVTWMLAVTSTLSAPHLQPDDIAGRLERLEQLESLLLAKLRDIIQETDGRVQPKGCCSLAPLPEPPQETARKSEGRQASTSKARLRLLAVQGLLHTLQNRIEVPQWCRAAPGEDLQLALILLSQVQEALGHAAVACDVSEAAAFTASSLVDFDGCFTLHPFVLNGVRAWGRVTNLLLRQGKFSAAVTVATHVLKQACGWGHESFGQSRWPDSEEQEFANAKGIPDHSEETHWFPEPPAAAGVFECNNIVKDGICAPGAVVDLLVALAKAQIALGYPLKALRLCKWARHYARGSKVDKSIGFAHASLLASQILADCPDLLSVARLNDAEVRHNCRSTEEIPMRAAEPETEAEERWQLVTQLRTEALQAEYHLSGPMFYWKDSTLRADHSQSNQQLLPRVSGEPIQDKETLKEADESKGKCDNQITSVWQPSALPKLYQLTGSNVDVFCSEDPNAGDLHQNYINLHDPSVHREVALRLEIAEAVQHQMGKVAEYSNIIQSAALLLRTIGEPSPVLCARLWIHQLRVFRLNMESRLMRTWETDFASHAESCDKTDLEKPPDILMTEQLLRYFRMVMHATRFIEAFCRNCRRLQKSLFTEAVLLSIQILAAPRQLLLRSACASTALVSRLHDDALDLVKKAALGGVQFCISALQQLSQQQRLAGPRSGAPELHSLLDAPHVAKPLVRLFLALRDWDVNCASIEETSSEDHMSYGEALRVLERAIRRCEVLGSWVPADEQLANCLHLILFSSSPSMQPHLSCFSHLTSDAFASAIRTTTNFDEKARKDGGMSDGASGKKDAKKENKVPPQEDSCSTPAETQHDLLQKALAVQPTESSAVRLLWLSPGAATAESMRLLHASLAAACDSRGRLQGADKPAARRATVTSSTGCGNFTLSLGETANALGHNTTEKAILPQEDAAVLLTFFSGSQFFGSNDTLGHNPQKSAPSVVVSVRTCSRQKMQALGTACHSVSLAVKSEVRAKSYRSAHLLPGLQADGGPLDSRILNVLARVFAALNEGRRNCAAPQKEAAALELPTAGRSPAVDCKPIVAALERPGDSAKPETGALAPSVLIVSEAEAAEDQRAVKAVRIAENHDSGRNAENGATVRSKKRKSIADFFAETSCKQQTSLESERSESFLAANALLAALKKESLAAEKRQKTAKTTDRAPPSKEKGHPRQDITQNHEGCATQEGAHVTACLDFFSSFLGRGSTALECKQPSVAKFLYEALQGHRIVEFEKPDE
ncbi:hypothetical protein Esti_002493 [Eimeria stiedai]